MIFSESITTCLGAKYAVFKGRAIRSEFWWYVLFIDLYGLLVNIGLQFDVPLGFLILTGSGLLYLIIPLFAVMVRRFHDVGKSGWTVLINIIPLIGPLFVLYWLVKSGDKEANLYGEVPLT
jgi:uncharacterized membrane protein YhaH (DUF805 family)